jgi:cyclic beta-1,2-glucan synthetase
MIDPNISRQYILRACRVQFKEGDVLHWWHNIPNSEGGVRGVRTRYSDDLLWLPFVVHDYVIKTGDEELLNIVVGYLDGEILKDGDQERYFVPTTSKLKETVYQHCIRAINHAHRLGEHGLPLIGCGDWSDGYNRVGVDGRGESVWLAMFFSIVADKFAEICSMKDDSEMCEKLKNISSQLKKNIDAHCWDGK